MKQLMIETKSEDGNVGELTSISVYQKDNKERMSIKVTYKDSAVLVSPFPDSVIPEYTDMPYILDVGDLGTFEEITERKDAVSVAVHSMDKVTDELYNIRSRKYTKAFQGETEEDFEKLLEDDGWKFSESYVTVRKPFEVTVGEEIVEAHEDLPEADFDVVNDEVIEE